MYFNIFNLLPFSPFLHTIHSVFFYRTLFVMGHLQHLTLHSLVVLNSDGGAAWAFVWTQVALSAISYKLLDEVFFSIIHLVLVNGYCVLSNRPQPAV